MSKKNKKWEIIENIKIDKIWYWWVGIWVLENKKKVIIKWTVLPNSLVKIRITKTKKDYIEWTLTEITHYEWKILKAPCVYYPICGWCKWQNIDYETQLDIKMKMVIDSFRLYPNVLDNVNIYDVIYCTDIFNYRNKIEFSFGKFITNLLKIDKQQKEENMYIREVLNNDIDDTDLLKLNSDSEVFTNSNNEKIETYSERNCGFHKQWFFSKVMDIQECKLISNKMNNIYLIIKNICKKSSLPVYDQKTHEWFFRHLVIREGKNTNQILINLVVCGKYIDTKDKEEKFELLKKTIQQDDIKSQINSFVISYNSGLADIVRSQDTKTDILRWDGFIFEYLEFFNKNTSQKELKKVEMYVEDGKVVEKKVPNSSDFDNTKIERNIIKFRISPFAFFQTNTKWAEILFQKAMDMVWENKWTILDLYCWAWTIWISFIKQSKWDFLIWVEVVPEAIEDAIFNAEINNIKSKSYFVAGKAEVLVNSDNTIKQKINNLSLIIVDPPRDGMHKSLIGFLNDIKSKHNCKLLYISCGPVSMARDIDLLIKWWWKFQSLQPVDMFAQTHHIENIWLLI